MKDLKHKVIRGGVAKALAQGTSLVLRMGSLMVLARLLAPTEFGLVGMVTAFTGVLNLFRDFGLSTATVQRGHVTDEQISTLFWINILVGAVLAFMLMGMAPVVAVFYHEPRLVWVSIVLATSFIFNGAGVQHTALLERQMRFTALATIDIISLVVSTAIGIGMAVAGFGYWSLLLGRYWGANALGLYGRAYQLINLPTENLNSAFWGVAFSGLSRVRHEPERFRSYFLRGYSLVLALTIPMTLGAALFAHDMIFVLLGPKWNDVAGIFRLLAPTILIFALINPLAWLTFSLGMIGRNLKIVLVLAPLIITGYVLGLPYGPRGVAIGYSALMTIWAVPHIAWCVHGTVISLRDIFVSASRPFLSGIVAGGIAWGVQFFFGPSLLPLPRLILEVAVLLAAYLGMLFYVMGQKAVYWDLLRGFRRSSAVEEDTLVPA